MKRLALSVFVICAFATTSLAQAQVTRIEFKRVESPTFEGRVLGDVGQYEKLVGIGFGEVDPTDPRNALITDIDFAPRNDHGLVEYQRPHHDSRCRRRVLDAPGLHDRLVWLGVRERRS